MKGVEKMNDSLMTCEELLEANDGSFVVGNKAAFGFTSVVTDSRAVKPYSLFVPLVGQNQNGHIYIPDSIKKGASVIFIGEDEYRSASEKYEALAKENSGVCLVVVRNTLTALQNAAARYVQKFPSLIKVGITGSSGKTTTKEMTAAVLGQKYNVVYTQGNFNSETGLPLSVFNIRKEHEVGVFEMGMNRENEIGEISSVLKAQFALITNVGTAHIGILGSRKNIAIEKRKIFEYIPSDGAAFIPAEDDFADFLGERVRGAVVLYGESVPENDSGARFVEDRGLEGTVFALDGVEIHLRQPGVYNYRNALGACAMAKWLGVDAMQVKAALEGLESVSGRMETASAVLKSGAAVTLIKDCYNANPDSMLSVLRFCGSLKKDARKLFVLGDMRELGEKSRAEHECVALFAARSKPALLVLVGEEMRAGYEAVKAYGFCDVVYIPECDAAAMQRAADEIVGFAKDGDVVLLKASHGLSLERIVPLVSKDGAQNG